MAPLGCYLLVSYRSKSLLRTRWLDSPLSSIYPLSTKYHMRITLSQGNYRYYVQRVKTSSSYIFSAYQLTQNDDRNVGVVRHSHSETKCHILHHGFISISVYLMINKIVVEDVLNMTASCSKTVIKEFIYALQHALKFT